MTIPSTAKIYMHQMAITPAGWVFEMDKSSTPLQRALEIEIAKRLDKKTKTGKHVDQILGKMIPFVIKLPEGTHTLTVKVEATNIHIVSKQLEYRLSIWTYS